MHKIKFPLFLASASIFFASCGTSASSLSGQPSSHTLTKSQAAATYLKAATTVDSSMTNFGAAMDSLAGTADASKFQSAFTPLIRALGEFHTTLTNTAWPASTESDVKRLSATASTVKSDIEAIAKPNFTTLSQQGSNVVTDLAHLTKYANLFRKDLGLQPSKVV